MRIDYIIYINDYVNELLHNARFRVQEYKLYRQGYCLANEFKGVLSPDVLNKAIIKSKRNRKIGVMLTDILYYADEETITKENFDLLCVLPKNWGKKYFSSIAHLPLQFYQLRTINRISGDYEAFAQLFDWICREERYDKDDMNSILAENAAITRAGLSFCIQYATEKYGTSEKLDVAIAWHSKWQ